MSKLICTYRFCIFVRNQYDMDTKLTLKLNQSIIEKAKEYAEFKGKSLSYLVEEFFQELVKEREASYNYAVSELDEIRSLVKGKIPKGLDYKEEIKKVKLEEKQNTHDNVLVCNNGNIIKI